MAIVLTAVIFVLFFLLADFFNGINGNYLIQFLKRSFIVVAFILLADALLCFLIQFWLPAQVLILTLELIVVFAVFFVKFRVESLMRYVDVETGKGGLFGNQTVMVFVPHQDDELNLMGGVLEEYVKHGSKVLVVFSTNGDGREPENPKQSGSIRIKEAVRALGFLGIPDDHIFFLGYGDGWNPASKHIYNCEDNGIVRSYAGRTKTYGTDFHPAYHEGRAYARENFISDIKDIILEHKPDTLYCVDYDSHNEHRALSMMFEKAMGEILRETNYRPAVYKGFAYRTAWNAPRDFDDSINLLSTVERRSETDVEIYDWGERVRVPIDCRSINRSLKRSKLYKALELYESQQACLSAPSIINGDKVFWEREVASLCYGATIEASSGDATRLNDFMLLDCGDLAENGDCPFDGVWHPEDGDDERRVTVSWDNPQYVDRIVLYDNPSPDDNILDATIILPDGERVATGPLKPFGQGSLFEINNEIQWFSVVIDKYEGQSFGLCEIEAFSERQAIKRPFIKLMDANGNFAYDFIIADDAKQEFRVYNHTNAATPRYQVKCNNKRCLAEMHGGLLGVECPKGEKTTISVTNADEDGEVSDSILIRNPGTVLRCLFRVLGQNIQLNKTYAHQIYRRTKAANELGLQEPCRQGLQMSRKAETVFSINDERPAK